MAALGGVFAHKCPALAAALVIAGRGDDAALRQAHDLLEGLPALNKRRLLASYAQHVVFAKKAVAAAG
jgi:hypothetical protein